MDLIRKYLTAQNAEHNTNFIKACLHKELIPLAEHLRDVWLGWPCPNPTEENKDLDTGPRNSDITVAFGGTTIDCISVNFHLLYCDSMRGPLVEKILETAINDDRFVHISQNDYEEMGWRAWKFTTNSRLVYPLKAPVIMLRFWYSASKTCKLQETGEFAPVMEVVCE